MWFLILFLVLFVSILRNCFEAQFDRKEGIQQFLDGKRRPLILRRSASSSEIANVGKKNLENNLNPLFKQTQTECNCFLKSLHVLQMFFGILPVDAELDSSVISKHDTQAIFFTLLSRFLFMFAGAKWGNDVLLIKHYISYQGEVKIVVLLSHLSGNLPCCFVRKYWCSICTLHCHQQELILNAIFLLKTSFSVFYLRRVCILSF